MRKPSEVIKDYPTEYQEGIKEFKDRCSVNSKCPDGPYEDPNQKISWLTGWLDARTEAALGYKIYD